MTTPQLAVELLAQLLVKGTIGGSILWEQVEDPIEPDGDSAVRLVNDDRVIRVIWDGSEWAVPTIYARHEKGLMVKAGDKVEQFELASYSLYWSAMGSASAPYQVEVPG